MSIPSPCLWSLMPSLHAQQLQGHAENEKMQIQRIKRQSSFKNKQLHWKDRGGKFNIYTATLPSCLKTLPAIFASVWGRMFCCCLKTCQIHVQLFFQGSKRGTPGTSCTHFTPLAAAAQQGEGGYRKTSRNCVLHCWTAAALSNPPEVFQSQKALRLELLPLLGRAA